jgi:beta-galactosidase
MVHLFPHWNWQGNEGEIIPVLVYSNCDSVELFLNGKSFGIKTLQFPQQGNSKSWLGYDRPFVSATTSDLHLSWDVPYQPGILKVVGRKNGTVVTEEKRTTSIPFAIRLSADRNEVNADAQDIANIMVEIVDENGLLVPNANVDVEFKIEGEGKLIGTDNGDPSDKTPMKSNKRRSFNGLSLAVVQSAGKPGIIKITAVSVGLKSGNLQIVTRKPENQVKTVESLN